MPTTLWGRTKLFSGSSGRSDATEAGGEEAVMSFALLFWILMLFWLVYGFFYNCSGFWGGRSMGRRCTR